MYPHLVPNIYHLKSRISFPDFAESRHPPMQQPLQQRTLPPQLQKSIAESAATAAVFLSAAAINFILYLTGNW